MEYNSTNASTLTLTPGSGSSIPTTTFSGAATGFIIDSSTPITLIGQFDDGSALPDNLRYRIFNNTQSTELYNDTVTGGAGLSISTTIGAGLAIEVGDSLTFTAAFQSGTTYLREMSATINANTTSNIFNVVESTWTEIQTFGLDGSTLDGVVFNDQTGTNRIDVLSDWTYAQFVSWWGFILTTELGIRNWFGAVTTIDNANARINNTVADILLDNPGVTEYFQTVAGRIFRADEARPVANPTSGGGGLDPQWLNQVLSINIGGSALTPGEQAQLATSSTQSTAAASSSAQAVTDIAAVPTNVWGFATRTLTDGVVIRNQAFNDLGFIMFDTNGAPLAGLTPTGEVSIDGAPYAAVAGTITEVGLGTYSIDLLAADTDGETLMFRFSAPDARDAFVQVLTS